ncbi:MAG: PD-(D/E)XK nuclease family protein, partial [Planctomycetota bacterium]
MTSWFALHGLSGDWLTPLDRFYHRSLPTAITAALVNEQLSVHDSSDTRMVARLVEVLDLLLNELNEQRRALIDWIAVWRRVLWRIYGEREYDLANVSQRRTYRACELLIEALDDIRSVPTALLGEATAREALELAFSLGGSARIPAPSDEPAIELLGWLELALDDAPALIIVGLNDGVVPESVNADPFLPNRLRTQLKLDDNARRFARDAYALSVLVATRTELQVIVGRHDLEGNPLAPSRLLFACDRRQIAERMLRWCSGEDDATSIANATTKTADTLQARSNFPIPMPTDVADRLPRKRNREQLELNVTDFKRYQDCPYRFFLERWGGLQVIGDDIEELDGRGFGILAHEVLERFGASPCRDSDNVEQIESFLTEELDQVV